MADKYKDPDNLDEIITKIKSLNSLQEICELVYQIYPEWILYFLKCYSQDYPHLQNNWESLASKNKVRPSQIMIVDYFTYDESHKLLNIIAEIYTLSGFMVRSKEDIIPCEKCDRAIPTLERFTQIKESGNIKLSVKEWSPKCSTC